MAINLAAKYSSKVDERFKLASVIGPATNQDYDFEGVDTVKVYSVSTAAQSDYTRSGTSRYGTPAELADTVQTMTLTKDRAFTFTVDKGNDSEQVGVKNAGVALRRQLDEVTIPELDIYVLGKIIAGAGTVKASETIDKTNAYDAFLTGMAQQTEDKVPALGRVAYVTPAFFKALKQDDSFIKNSDLGQEITINGQLGKCDGVPIIVVPSTYLTAGTNFVITHPMACVAPVKLAEYKLHMDAPGISGALAEGRTIYDAFILANKTKAIYLSKSVA